MQLSVIIPTYCPKAYLWDTLDSLVKQTLAADDFEIIIVLNGPRAPYEEQIAEYIGRITSGHTMNLLYSETAGVSHARNLAISKAQGNYLCFIDDDDWVSPCYLEDLLQRADESSIVASNVRNYNQHDGSYSDDYLAHAFTRCSQMPHVSLTTGRSLLSSSCCKIIPRAVIADDRYDTRITHGEDALFMTTISPRIKAIRLSSPDAIYYRRVHPASASRHSRSLFLRLHNTSRLFWRYLRLLFRPSYDKAFILTRLLACVKRFFVEIKLTLTTK